MSDLPTTRTAVSAAASSLSGDQWTSLRQRGSKLFFDGFRTLFGGLGLDTAAKNLRRYRSGVGGTQAYSDTEIEKHPLVTEAEDTNRTRFTSRTLTGQTDRKDLNDRLLNMKDGERFTFQDKWNTPGKLDSLWSKASNPDTFASFGAFDIRSTGDLIAERTGNKLRVTGSVRHGFDEESEKDRDNRRLRGDFIEPEENMYNFNKGAIGSGAARDLEPVGAARPFRMQYDRVQDLDAELEYAPSGGLLLRRAKWGSIR